MLIYRAGDGAGGDEPILSLYQVNLTGHALDSDRCGL